MTGKIPSIPEPGNDIQSLIHTTRALKDAVTQLSRNEQGVPSSQIFQLAGSTPGQTSTAASAYSSTATATVQLAVDIVSNMIVMFGYYGSAASSGDTLQLSLDGTLVASVPMVLVASNAIPQQGAQVLTNVGIGLHTLTVSSANGLSGFYVAALAFGA